MDAAVSPGLQDLIDQLQPDLMYHDGVIRFGGTG